VALLSRSLNCMKPVLLHVYLRGTTAYRRRLLRELARDGRVPIVVPVFHRVADDRANDWTTSTSEFREAIAWLQEHFDLISLEEAQHRIASGKNERPSVSITFDDGYAVNCNYALPLLIDNAIPCTYFVSSGPVLERTNFEHDQAMGNHFASNTVVQLRELAGAGIEIGAHTRTHIDLGRVCDPDRLFRRACHGARRVARRARPANPLFRVSLRHARQPQRRRLPIGPRSRLRGRLLGVRRLQRPW
jgi:peptidoglycan/xylan/chitin deacetylase (PgdA/CDA1 family)